MKNEYDLILIESLEPKDYWYIKNNHIKTIPLYFNDEYEEIVIMVRHYKELLEYENEEQDFKDLLNHLGRDRLC